MSTGNRTALGLFLGLLAVALVAVFWRGENASEYIQANASYVLSKEELDRLQSQAVAGDAMAAIRLAKYYNFIVLDKQAAIRWWNVAAKLGNVDAQYTIGMILADSADPIESEEGLRWLRQAAANGDKSAARLLEAHSGKKPRNASAR